MVVLTTLLDNPGLRLELVTGQDPADIPVHWAHVSELHDPTEFLEGGELLLVTGVNLPSGRVALAEYAARLVAAGVSALGYGVGVTRETVPVTLLDACRQHDLPLVVIPRAVPFLAITRAMAQAIADEERTEREYIFATQRRLTATAVESGGPEALVRELARTLGSWALLLDRAGEVVTSAPAAAYDMRDRLATDVDRLAQRKGAASLLTKVDVDEVWLQSLAVGKKAVGFLVLGRQRPFAARERQVVNLAVPLFVLAMSRAQVLDQDRQRLETSVLQLLIDGQRDLVEPASANLWDGLPAEPVQVISCRGGRLAVQAARERLAADPRSAAERIVFGVLDHSLVLLSPVGERAVATVLSAVSDQAALRLGVSTPVGFDALARGLAEANRAARWAEAERLRVARFSELPPVSLLALLPEKSARRFADSWLRPLLGGRGELVTSLRVWLEHHGQWDPAAAELGVHRHTLRNRVHKAEALLDRRLDSVENRAELWLALQLYERDEDLGV